MLLPTETELEAIRDFILLPIMLTIVERNRQGLEISTGPLKQLYLAAADSLLNQIHADLVQTRKALKAADIKVWEMDLVDYAIHYRFLCRGYEDTFSMMRELVKAEVGVRLKEYAAKVVNDARK